MSQRAADPDATLGESSTWTELPGERPAAATPTTIDDERYELVEEIARGGMGRVHLAHDRKLGRAVAVKELLWDNPVGRARFEREATITARLQHPSIVPIYDAVLGPDQRLRYSMRLVAGRSLEAQIAAAPSLSARLALLPNAIAVADAIAYAHSRRIIHRDLKPLNVLVGDFGETVVIDWGLAKDLASDDGTPRDEPPVYADPDDKLTQWGALLGTLAYMAPEQARGDVVDERVDVYALGAMLYHLLAGAPPYAGAAPLTRARVLDGPPPPLRRLLAGLPDDLVAIVDKAMAVAPAARYPTARELAADLHRFQTGQLVSAHRYSAGLLVRRFVRRHRAAVSATAVLLIALIAVGTVSVLRVQRERDAAELERDAAVQARRRERAQRDAAEELVDFMITDLRASLRRIDKVSLLASVGQRVEDYYAAVAVEDGPAAKAASFRRLTALQVLGDALMQKGETEAARRTYLQQAVAAEKAGNFRMWANAQNNASRMFERQGKLDDAIAMLRAANRRATEHGDRVAAFTSGIRLSWVLLDRGDLDAQQSVAEQALRDIEFVVAKQPVYDEDDPLYRNTWHRIFLAWGHHAVGNARASRYDDAGALASFQEAVNVARAVVAVDPDNSLWQRELAALLSRIAAQHLVGGDLDAARATFDEASALRERLVVRDPDNLEWQDYPAIRDEYLGRFAEIRSAWSEALVLRRRALARYQRNATIDPTSLVRVVDVARSTIAVAHLVRRRDPASAIAMYRTAIAMLVASPGSESAYVRFQQASARRGLALALLARGAGVDGAGELRASIALLEAIPAGMQFSARRRDVELAAACVDLARTGEPGEPAARAVALLERLDEAGVLGLAEDRATLREARALSGQRR